MKRVEANFSREEWRAANQNLIGKAIGEMSYEQLLTPELLDEASGGESGLYRLQLQSGVVYRFQAGLSVWDYLRVKPCSVLRESPGQAAEAAHDAAQFFIDSQAESAMTDIILGNFLDEMHHTLYSDLHLNRRQSAVTADDLIAMPGDKLQSYLDGHPKILLNKGRMGWGVDDLQDYAPESGQTFKLFWVAAQRDCLKEGWDPELSEKTLLSGTMQATEAERLGRARKDKNLPAEAYRLIPLHPWQWEHVIQLQFAGEIAQRRLVPLGYFGDHYQAQVSLRTLSNVDAPERMNLKLSLSILNTSCVRGIPGRYIEIAPQLSRWLATIAESDPFLLESGLRILREPLGLFYEHPNFQQVAGAPYRYQEYLGAIWRESPESFAKKGDTILLTSALFQKDAQGQALISAYVRASGLSLRAWLQAYFEVVVLPLYHLQCKYGVGVVAHGQNTVLILNDYIPSGLILKDMQGDLRLVDQDYPELASLDESIKKCLSRLPVHYLIHDLQTAHFVTVLRFISATLKECENFSETAFYQLLVQVLLDYQARFPELKARFQAASLLSPRLPRILVNKVRFRLGYGDTAERLLPELGTELINPLYRPPSVEGSSHVSD